MFPLAIEAVGKVPRRFKDALQKIVATRKKEKILCKKELEERISKKTLTHIDVGARILDYLKYVGKVIMGYENVVVDPGWFGGVLGLVLSETWCQQKDGSGEGNPGDKSKPKTRTTFPMSELKKAIYGIEGVANVKNVEKVIKLLNQLNICAPVDGDQCVIPSLVTPTTKKRLVEKEGCMRLGIRLQCEGYTQMFSPGES